MSDLSAPGIYSWPFKPACKAHAANTCDFYILLWKWRQQFLQNAGKWSMYETTNQHIPEDSNFHCHCWEPQTNLIYVGFQVFTVVTMKNAVSGMWRCDLVWTKDLHDATSQKTAFFKFLLTSMLMSFYF
jgi:hypothetical protein